MGVDRLGLGQLLYRGGTHSLHNTPQLKSSLLTAPRAYNMAATWRKTVGNVYQRCSCWLLTKTAEGCSCQHAYNAWVLQGY